MGSMESFLASWDERADVGTSGEVPTSLTV
jgi:hypothetical protein